MMNINSQLNTTLIVLVTVFFLSSFLGADIAFEAYREKEKNHEIYLTNEYGTNPKNLTNNKADDGAPLWSFDGKRIAFLSNRSGSWEIYIMNADGTNQKRLSNTRGVNPGFGNFAWSPDSKKIAFTSLSDGQLYVIDLESGNTKKLTNNKISLGVPNWSPDGKQIVFIESEAYGSLKQGNNEALWVIDADGKNQRQIFQHKDLGLAPVAWSPNGKKIVFVMRSGPICEACRDKSRLIYVIDTDGKNLKRLTDEKGCNRAATWSPDGKKIAFISMKKVIGKKILGQENWWLPDLCIMDADGKSQRNLTNINKSGIRAGIYTFSWSPDSRKLVFDKWVRDPSVPPTDCKYEYGGPRKGTTFDIYMINVNGSNLRRLTNPVNMPMFDAYSRNRPFLPAWSPGK